MILPQIEQANLHSSIDFNLPIAAPVNQFARSMRVKEYQCPSDAWTDPVTVWPNTLGITDLAHTSYVASLGGGDPANVPGYSAMYEEQPFNGMCSIVMLAFVMLRSLTEPPIRLVSANVRVCLRRTDGLE